MRVAALDVGTDTTRALIADVADGRVDEVVRRTAITRLGEGVGRSRTLLPTAVARVRKALDEYMREVDRHGVERALLVATSAVRDSDNGEELLRDLECAYGVDETQLARLAAMPLAQRLRIPALEPGRDDLPHERLSRHDPEQPPVVVTHEEHADLGTLERLARLLRGRVAAQHGRVGDHRVAHAIHRRSVCRGRESNPHGREAGRF